MTPYPDCAVTNLDALGLIRVSGEDAVEFLQGQLTNDVRKIEATNSQLTAFCNPKGRMLGLFRSFMREGDIYLQTPVERLPPLLKRLQMFVLRSRVTLEDMSGELRRIGIAGDCAASLLPETPAAVNGVCQHDALTIIQLPGDRPRFEVIGPGDAIESLHQTASGSAQTTDADFWPLLDIRAGLPSVYDATAEAFVPQMTNLQVIDGVSFHKGCYTGQEVVARMQYLGKLKRRMYRIRLPKEATPAIGDALYAGGDGSGQGVGKIVDVRPSPDGGFEALAVIQIESAENAPLHLGASDGPRVSLDEMPYAFDVEEAG